MPGDQSFLAEWPVRRPADWLTWVNKPQSAAEEQSLRQSLSRGRPFGDPDWQAKTAVRLGLEKSFRPRGRPPKAAAPATGASGTAENRRGK